MIFKELEEAHHTDSAPRVQNQQILIFCQDNLVLEGRELEELPCWPCRQQRPDHEIRINDQPHRAAPPRVGGARRRSPPVSPPRSPAPVPRGPGPSPPSRRQTAPPAARQ